MTELEIRIPISLTDSFVNRVHLIAHSVRSLGGIYSNANIFVSVGSEFPIKDLYHRFPWSESLGIVWDVIMPNDFLAWRGTAHAYVATVMARFKPPFNTKYVLMLDADVLAISQFDDVLKLLDTTPGIAGLMAHVSPFPNTYPEQHRDNWAAMYRAFELDPPLFAHNHSGWGLMDNVPQRRLSPPYFNTGVLFATGQVFSAIYDTYMKALYTVKSNMDNFFIEQIALTLAIARQDVQYHILSHKYNFPNRPSFDFIYDHELNDIKLLHFLQTDVIDRNSDFESVAALQRLVSRTDLIGSNEVLRKRVEHLLPLVQADRANLSSSEVRKTDHHAGQFFNRFVTQLHPGRKLPDGSSYAWPGDEWSTHALTGHVFEELFSNEDLQAWSHCVEFGPGSGKYTEMLLARSGCAIRAYDISDRFLNILRERCRLACDEGRLTTHLIDWSANAELVHDLEAAGWLGDVDAVFGVDVFIHIDLQSLVVYFLSSALALREGGKLIGVFADPLSSTGKVKLFNDIRQYEAFTTVPSSKFYWITRETLIMILEELGFQIDSIAIGDGERLDVARSYVVATLINRSRAEALRHLLGETDPSNRPTGS